VRGVKTESAVYHADDMDRYDPAAEYLQIAERYRQMSDEELLALVPQSLELTPFAQQALAGEVRQRGIKVEIAAGEKPPAPQRFRPPDSFRPGTAELTPTRDLERKRPVGTDSVGRELPYSDSDSSSDEDLSEDAYDEDRKLVDLLTVYSVRDALKMQSLLDDAGIPFFIGPEKATGVDQVTSDFSQGLVVRIMQIGIPLSRGPMRNYFPKDDPTPKVPEEVEEIPVRCPECGSTEVVFEDLVGDPPQSENDKPQKFAWVCDACGHRWEDDGVVKEE
jgi:hypothetical protein